MMPHHTLIWSLGKCYVFINAAEKQIPTVCLKLTIMPHVFEIFINYHRSTQILHRPAISASEIL